MNHVWIKEKAPKAKNIPISGGFVDNLRGFRSQNKLKKAALHIIAGELSDSQIKNLRETFQALDKNGDGLLTSAEMKEGLEKAGLKDIPPDLKQILQDDVCWSAFRLFDRNGDGKISQEELKTVLEG